MTAAAGERQAVPVPVVHRLFTNAPGGDDGAGFRHLRIGALADGARVESWLQSLRPASDGGLAWAGGAFRLGGALHLAVARVDGAFHPDEHGRGRGHLAHALVAPAGEDDPDRDLAAELIAAAERLARPAGEAGDLETLVRACASLADVECRSLARWWHSAAAMTSVPREGLTGLDAAVLAASADEAAAAVEVAWPAAAPTAGGPTAAASAGERAGATAVTEGAAAPDDAAAAARVAAPAVEAAYADAVPRGSTPVPDAGGPTAAPPATSAAVALAAACRALPPRLRLALRWSVAARPLPDDRLRVTLAAATPSAPSPLALAGAAAGYAEWLRDRLAAGDGAAVAAVAGDWQIRSWRHLAERLGAGVAR